MNAIVLKSLSILFQSSVAGLNRAGPQRGAIFFCRVRVILSACRLIRTDAVPGAIAAAVSGAISAISPAVNAAAFF